MATSSTHEIPEPQKTDAKEAVSDLVPDHETLKYHLLGPSLTKAGQDSVDQQKVSEVIYNASKGSKFFNNEEVKDKNLTQKIDRILARKKQLERLDLATDLRRADDYITELELSRDLSQTVVHIDCDAFYAAVELLDHPELAQVPFAVGKGVLTTCNYHARKFGCRSGMAGFVAQKLCPELIQLPLNFEKYTGKAQEVRTILAEYDPTFESASIDEAYMNITEYCETNEIDPWDAVMQLRKEVEEKTQITISAGLAPNAKIAKIASNRNKPNGQFRVANDRPTILAFMRDLPTRKVNGIGRVFERELDAIGVKTCGDIYDQRQYLSKLFGEKAFQFLMQTYLGLGRTKVQPAEDYERKSVGTESTFRDMSDPKELRDKLQWIAEELEKDMLRAKCKGRTLCLKIKLHTYEVLTRQAVTPKAIAAATDLYKHALPMLTKLEREIPGMKLRLMGLRCTHLVSTKKFDGRDFFFGLQRFSSTDSGEVNENGDASSPSRAPITQKDDDGEWEVWPEEEFEAAARQEREEELEQAERLSQEHEAAQTQQHRPPMSQEEQLEESNRRYKHGRAILPNPTPSSTPKMPKMRMDSGVGFRKPETGGHRKQEERKQGWMCPVCGVPQEADERGFNEHVDFCLSRGTIMDAVRESPPPPTTTAGVEGKGGGEDGLVGSGIGGRSMPLTESAGASNASGVRKGRPKGKRKGEGGVEKEKGIKKLCWGNVGLG